MLALESYQEHERHLPATGRFIIGQFSPDHIIVYQAFNAEIAAFAVTNQRFGGDAYAFDRTTHLKPSFLWMMYYSGWAKHKDQECVLAISIKRSGFEAMIGRAVLEQGSSSEATILVQWMPYYDLLGAKTDRFSVRIALRGDALAQFNNEWIQKIEDITDYVHQQQQLVIRRQFAEVQIPKERVFAPADLRVLQRIDATTISL